MTDIFSVRDQVVCITGSSRGLGKTLARAFAEHGAKVILTSFNDPELQQTFKELAHENPAVKAIPCDVSRTADCKNLIAKTIEKFGKIAPGYLNNIMDGVVFDPNDPYQKRIIQRTLMGRRGNLEEFIGPYLFPASNASSYVTGQVI
jgi:NAD(P)-dependent dehydrogenase (short-subunit alcohol dehydrogenase family)